jgi:hypothetical protein
MNKRFLAAALIAFAGIASTRQAALAAEEGEGKTETVSADNKPAFTITLPAGWKLTEPATLSSTISDESLDVTGQFDKLGELDAEAAKKKASSEAQIFLTMGGDDKNPPAPPAKDKEIAGNKGFVIEASYNSSGKSKALRLYGFSLDGKTYYEFILQAPPDKLESADEIAESIATPK